MNNNRSHILLTVVLLILRQSFSIAGVAVDVASGPDPEIPKLENPISLEYLKKNLRKTSPRLVLNAQIKKNLKKKLRTDPVIKNMYQAITINVESILDEPLMERKMNGRRLLSVSREMLYRINMLGMAYQMEEDSAVLNRINQELMAVCNFSDWNPNHFLDVAEMALAVAMAIDWAGEDLPASTVELAKTALVEKAILPSYGDDHEVVWWINTANNWNQVCHGGMIAASIAVAEKNPELAAKTIHRALENIPIALAEYGPDGVYPEGATYWGYGTSFTVITAAILESAFGTDFGISEYPAFKESANYKLLSIAPSGLYYNFGDSYDTRNDNGDFTLAWFGAKTGNPIYFERERFLMPPSEMGKLSRLDGAGLVWLSQFKEKNTTELLLNWKGSGSNPIVYFRGGEKDPNQYYLGCKGGGGMINHGNMDGGSFIFELNGVRWSIDPGIQSYNDLEKTGFDLWSNCQTCDRWKLLTKSNFGHSTLSVNQERHVVDGLATLEEFKAGERPEATFDLTAIFDGQLKSAKRTFIKDSPTSLLIEDQIGLHESTHYITWQMMTTADVQIVEDGALLSQDGEELHLQNLSHPNIPVTVISLDPPPLKLDKQIVGLKRIEIRIPESSFKKEEGAIRVRLKGN